MQSYVAILIPEKAGGYSVLFPDLPGCATQGENMAEAQEMAVEALSGWIAVTLEHDEPVPQPRSLATIKNDKAFANANGFIWQDVTAVLIPARPPLGRPERVNVSLDSNKLRAIDAYARRRGLTRSAVLEAGAEMLMESDPLPADGRRGLRETSAVYGGRGSKTSRRPGARSKRGQR